MAQEGPPRADSSTSSQQKMNPALVEIQAAEATTTEEHPSSLSTASAVPREADAPTGAESFSGRRPEDIWDRAYDNLRRDDAKLVDAYEKILSSRSSTNGSSPEASEPRNEIAQNPDVRRKQMLKIIKDGLQETKREADIWRGIGETAQLVLSAKGMVDSAIQAVPQAALAWAGVCFVLQVRHRL